MTFLPYNLVLVCRKIKSQFAEIHQIYRKKKITFAEHFKASFNLTPYDTLSNLTYIELSILNVYTLLEE